jgi:CHASE2 domain-containing sensor protein
MKRNIKQNAFKFLFFYLSSKAIIVILSILILTNVFQIFEIEEIGNPDIEWNDLHYKSVNFSDDPHYLKEKNVVLINSGSLNRDSFRLQLSKVLSKLGRINPKAIGIDHEFTNSTQPGTEELIKEINKNSKIIVAYDNESNSENTNSILNFDGRKGSADFPDDYTIRRYYNNKSTFGYQLAALAFQENLDDQNSGSRFTIHYSSVDNGLVEYSDGSNELYDINFKYMEASDFLEDSIFNRSFVESFKDKIVIIGHLGSNLIDKKFDTEDKFPVPIDSKRIMLRDRTMYGAVIHANAVENLIRPESKFYELNGFWQFLLHEILFIGFLLFLFLHYGRLINILTLIIISIPYSLIILKLMDFNIYIVISTTLFHLLFIEEFYEILEPFYRKIIKKYNLFNE